MKIKKLSINPMNAMPDFMCQTELLLKVVVFLKVTVVFLSISFNNYYSKLLI